MGIVLESSGNGLARFVLFLVLVLKKGLVRLIINILWSIHSIVERYLVAWVRDLKAVSVVRS